MHHKIAQLLKLHLDAAEGDSRLGFFPLLDDPPQILAERLLLFDEFRRHAAGEPVTAVAGRPLHAVELLGGHFEALGERVDEIVFLPQERFEFERCVGHGVIAPGGTGAAAAPSQRREVRRLPLRRA